MRVTSSSFPACRRPATELPRPITVKLALTDPRPAFLASPTTRGAHGTETPDRRLRGERDLEAQTRQTLRLPPAPPSVATSFHRACRSKWRPLPSWIRFRRRPSRVYADGPIHDIRGTKEKGRHAMSDACESTTGASRTPSSISVRTSPSFGFPRSTGSATRPWCPIRWICRSGPRSR